MLLLEIIRHYLMVHLLMQDEDLHTIFSRFGTVLA